MFPHTFEPDDVTVLLERVEPNYIDKAERDQMIASGVHYNELISKEAIPSTEIMELFYEQVSAFGDQMAVMVDALARKIAAVGPAPVLVSLVRAGTPTGILVRHSLANMCIEAPHFSVSIVQGRGFDVVAIDHIIKLGYRPEQLIFIDGWTGKGVVRRELSSALQALGELYGAPFRDELFVLSDIAGVAEHAATRADVLIPSALLSGPLCGLVSRTLYRGSQEAPEMHGAAFLDYMAEGDVSRWFISEMTQKIKAAWCADALDDAQPASEASAVMQAFLDGVVHDYGVPVSRIKPGVGESSRLFLRKKPMMLLVKGLDYPEVRHLVEMADTMGVPTEVIADMPYLACTLVG